MKKNLYLLSFVILVVALTACTPKENISTKLIQDQKAADEDTNRYEVAGISDPAEFEKTFNTIKELVARNDKEEVAAYVLYPLNVNHGSARRTIRTKQEFIKEYDTLMTIKVKKALANQNVKDTFVNYQGVMVGNGEIWFGISLASDKKYGILSINN
jgi:hypothetical protein